MTTNKAEYQVSEKVKLKRRWAFTILSILLVCSIILIYFPIFDRTMTIAITGGIFVLLLSRVIDWIENSNLK